LTDKSEITGLNSLCSSSRTLIIFLEELKRRELKIKPEEDIEVVK
jgi:hypothetical protein